jgi:hypothetical protein
MLAKGAVAADGKTGGGADVRPSSRALVATAKDLKRLKTRNSGKRLEDAVKKILDLYRISWWRVSSYHCFRCGQVQNGSAKGVPDFICASPDKGVFFVEAKTGSGKLTPEQANFKHAVAEWQYLELHDTVDELIKFLEGRK